MMEQILSVGIDIGTSTTQLVISRLTLLNRANPFSVPRIEIGEREIIYRSEIAFTPLLNERTIDAAGVRDIVEREYRRSGFDKREIQTGAVIITGETARKENARQVLELLAGFAGDFVVATAGPDLESILAARGALADEYSREKKTRVLHFDIGGGTSNLALYENGELTATGCFDVGGRLIRVDHGGRITYVTEKLKRKFPHLREGETVTAAELRPVTETLVRALEQAAGLSVGEEMEYFRTEDTRWIPCREVRCFSFSGGVADCIFNPPSGDFPYGDIGVLLGQAIASSSFHVHEMRRGSETIRATVVGAGAHATEISGSTVYYRGVTFPLKNIPILKLTAQEEEGDEETLAAAIEGKLRWFVQEGETQRTALGLRGWKSPGYERVLTLARGIARGLAEPIRRGEFPVLVIEGDMAKALGQALAGLVDGPILSLDGISVENGDYIDIGAPVAGGSVLPVVIKTLVFSKQN